MSPLERMRQPRLGCPSDLEVLLHCHYSGSPHPRSHAPAVQQGFQLLFRNGLIEETPDAPGQYNTTPKGKWFIEYLMDIPFPVETTIYRIPEA